MLCVFALCIVCSAGWAASTPYSGTPITFAGTIMPQYYDNGGEGVAYHDSTTDNYDGIWRTDQSVDFENQFGMNNLDLAYITTGEWVNWTVYVPVAGTYHMDIRVADGFNNNSFHMEFGGVNKTGTISVPNTGGADHWTTITTNNFNLSAGTQIMKFYADNADGYRWGTFNINYFTVYGPPVPEPSGLLALLTGASALGGMMLRRKKA